MRVCGIELKASTASLAVVEQDGEVPSWVETRCKKIELADDESGDAIRAFYEACRAFFEEHDIELVVIKKRSKKGNFAGGAVSFKMEALLQLGFDKVELLTPAAVSAAQRKHSFALPEKLKKYQQQAFLTACTALSKQAS